MNTTHPNRCPPGCRDFASSLTESGVEMCQWPTCDARRESPPSDTEDSVQVLTVAVEHQRAA